MDKNDLIGKTIVVPRSGFVTGGDFRRKIAQVHSAHNYGTDESPDWYIEGVDTFGDTFYWKQGVDGGYLQDESDGLQALADAGWNLVAHVPDDEE